MINKIHSYLVYPGKHRDTVPVVRGLEVTDRTGKLFGLLSGIFHGAEKECETAITFNSTDAQNDVRDLLVTYIRSGRIDSGRKIAAALQAVTTGRSGLGLLFLISGKKGSGRKLVISRFPVEQGIYVEEGGSSLTVEFLDRIFMKNAFSYKAAVYYGNSFSTGFWDGHIVDRQIKYGINDVSEYWIKEFLDSDFKTTAAAGTRRAAKAMQVAASQAKELDTKSALIGAVSSLKRLDGQQTSIREICDRFALPDEAVALIEKAVGNKVLMSESFQFSGSEYSRHTLFRAVETDKGVVVTAETSVFEKNVRIEGSGKSDRKRISTEGQLIDDRLKKRK